MGNYFESAGSGPHTFLPAGKANIIGEEIVHHYSVLDEGYLDDWLLAKCTRPAEWVVIVPLHLVNYIKRPSSRSNMGQAFASIFTTPTFLDKRESSTILI